MSSLVNPNLKPMLMQKVSTSFPLCSMCLICKTFAQAIPWITGRQIIVSMEGRQSILDRIALPSSNLTSNTRDLTRSTYVHIMEEHM